MKAVAEACTTAHKESGVKEGGNFPIVQLDVSDKQQVASLLDKIPENLRKVDVLGQFITNVVKLVCMPKLRKNSQ